MGNQIYFKIAGIVRHHWKEIQKRETLTKLFPEPPVVAFRRPKRGVNLLVFAWWFQQWSIFDLP
jgi:hypothetical protein